MNKKAVFLSLILVISATITLLFFTNITNVSAQASSCTNAQTMLYLSSPTNAHGATASASGYNTRVCYDNIFGTTFSGSGATTCTATNKIVRLSGATNAHAEEAGQTTAGYSDVCYGNLACTTRTLTACQGTEKEVLRLYGPSKTNTHLAVAGTSGATTLVCCKILGNVSGAHWENLIGEEITQTSTGSMVLMIVPGSNLNQVQINYTIEKKTTKWLFFKSWNYQSAISTLGEANWTPSEEGIYRFTAEVSGSGSKQTSPELTVNNDGNNYPPIVTIKAPIDTGIYFLSQTLNFSAEALDADDPTLSYFWSLGDWAVSSQPSILFQYKMPGQKSIILKVTDTRGASTEAKVDILIVNSSYYFAYISSPTYNQRISGLDVSFDASKKSYAVEVTYNPTAIKCIAGTCPNQTADGQTPISNTPAGIDAINFSWSLSDGYRKSGLGSTGAIFNYRFSNAGLKGAILNVSASSSNSSSNASSSSSTTWTNFTLYLASGVPYCSISSNGQQASWVTSTGSTNSLNDCYKASGQPASTCCPSGYSCDTSLKMCLPNSNASASFCSDYKIKTDCESYEQSVAEDSVSSSSNVTCGSVIRQYTENGTSYKETAGNCRCEWVASSTSGTNTCKSAYDIVKECVSGGAGCTGQSISLGSCQTTISLNQDLCSTRRVKVYSVNAVWSGNGTAPSTCQSGTIERSCIDFSQIKLPFFTSLQLAITIALIILFYIYISHKKRK